MPASIPPKVTVPDDDEFDDLDDVLDQFTAAPTKSQPTAPPPSATLPPKYTSTSIPSTSLPDGPQEADEIADDFARELAKGMEDLMRDLGAGASEEEQGGAPKTAEEKERDLAFKAAWESMLVEGMNGAPGGDVSALGDILGPAGVTAPPPKTDGTGAAPDFQSAIRQAREKLKESDSKLKADASTDATDPLEALLGQFGAGGESDEDFKGMLEMMMGQLMSKEVLYEPLKELHDKFPGYLKDNEATITAEDKTRYEAQILCIEKVMKAFDDPKYNEEDPIQSAKVVELMNEMQSHGSPPSEIMGDLPPGFATGQDGLPELPEGCTIA